jgi:multicomponent Na+:H+ antiporter subunit C
VSQTALYGLVGALLVGVGLYGLIVGASALRKLIAFNVLGSGVFLIFGVIARRGAGAGFGGDPVPQALVITGLVVAFAATALTVGLLVRLAEVSGRGDVDDDLRPAADPGKTRGLLPDPAATDAPAAAAKASARPQP